jgi:hypothetical protein
MSRRPFGDNLLTIRMGLRIWTLKSRSRSSIQQVRMVLPPSGRLLPFGTSLPQSSQVGIIHDVLSSFDGIPIKPMHVQYILQDFVLFTIGAVRTKRLE